MDNTLTVAGYLKDTLPDLRERIKHDVVALDSTAQALIASFRGVLHGGFTWVNKCEEHADASALREMDKAAFKVGGAKTVLDSYFKAVGQELPASVEQEYGDFAGLYEVTQEAVKAKLG